MVEAKNTLLDKLCATGQAHLVQHAARLDADERAHLLDDLAAVPLEKLQQWLLAAKKGPENRPAMAPLHSTDVLDTVAMARSERNRLQQLGLDMVRRGELAVVTMAGGQGTRLGSPLPKGCFDIGLLSQKSLFQLQAERLQRLCALAHSSSQSVAWYIMTSPATHSDTLAFFEQHAYFGLDREHVRLFEQGTVPALDDGGKLLLQDRTSVVRAPDGNGGIFKALASQHVLTDMSQRGIKYVHVYCVDNSLVHVGDPLFLGAAVEHGFDCAAKSVERKSADEAVGVFCRDAHGHIAVAEYSELPADMAREHDAHGNLVYRHANIANHLFTVAFLAQACSATLQYHLARKRIPALDPATGLAAQPPPMGNKLEMFIFDVFELAKHPLIVHVGRADEFAPLKNSHETDSAETCRQALYRLHRRWLEEAGASVDDAASDVCEVSPLVSYAGENLELLVGGQKLKLPFSL